MILELAFFLFLLLSGFFSSAETALFSFTTEELFSFSSGNYRQKLIAKIMRFPDRLLTVILVLNNFVNIVVVLTGALCIEKVITYFQIIDPGYVLAIIKFVLLTVTIFTFGEVLPKNMALKYPLQMATFGIIFLYPIYCIIHIVGIRKLVSFLVEQLLWFSRHILGKVNQKGNMESIQEGVLLLKEKNSISKQEATVLYNTFELKDVFIFELMVHRSKVKSVSADDKIETVIPWCLEMDQILFPVYDDSQDQVIGIFDVRKALISQKSGLVKTMMEKPQFLPMVSKSAVLIQLLSYRERQIRIIVNQFGEYEGVLFNDAMIDLLSKSLQESHKNPVLGVKKIFEGSTKLEEVEQVLNTIFPKGNYHTIAGLLTSFLKRIPQKDECISMKGWNFCVEEAEAHRIVKISVQ